MKKQTDRRRPRPTAGPPGAEPAGRPARETGPRLRVVRLEPRIAPRTDTELQHNETLVRDRG